MSKKPSLFEEWFGEKNNPDNPEPEPIEETEGEPLEENEGELMPIEPIEPIEEESSYETPEETPMEEKPKVETERKESKQVKAPRTVDAQPKPKPMEKEPLRQYGSGKLQDTRGTSEIKRRLT